MNTCIIPLIVVLALLGGNMAGRAQQRPASQEQPDDQPAQPALDEEAVGELIQAVQQAQEMLETLKPGEANRQDLEAKARALRGLSARGTPGTGTNATSLASLAAKANTNGGAGTNGQLRLNFRDASLSLVLDYLSEAAGFIVSPNSKVDLRGKVTVMASHPVNRDEAVQILDKALGEHNYAATVEGNLLSIYVVDSTTTPIPDPVSGSDYTKILPTKELVTQVVYVRNVEANALISSLQPLMPAGTSLSANQGANAIIITDTKANIRRMVQLVKVLDTPSVSASALEVFPLSYADATALAQVVTQLFQGNDASSNQGGRGGRGGGGFGGGIFPGFGGGDRGGGNNSGTAAGRVAAPKVTAVADDRSNSLVVSAPEDLMPGISNLVNTMDVDVDAVTELKVFRLRNADPQETADQLTSLFPDPTQQNRGRRQFGFGPFGAFAAGNTQTGQSSDRRTSQARVTAVPDPRTQSVLVSASRDMMPQIASIIDELDSDPSKKKKVHVIKVENRDPQELVTDLQSVIATDTSGGNFGTARNANNRQAGSQLNNRQQNNLQNQNQNNGFTQGFGQGNRGGTGR